MSKNSSNSSKGEGNTKPPPKQGSPQKNWCMTLNNYSEEEYNSLISFFNSNSSNRWIIGKEVGAEGTPHLQCFCHFDEKIRFTAIKKACDRLHIEPCKGKEQDNLKYCSKDGNYETNVKFKRDKVFLSIEELNAWELKIDNICRNEIPDDRIIYWVYSKSGNMGKTTFCKYLQNTYDACIIGGKSCDSKNCIATYISNSEDKRAPEVVICPIPRSYDLNYVSYEAIEMIKDMFFYSGKYEGCCVNDNSPHLFVFSNEPPSTVTDDSKPRLSFDRWKILEIIDKDGNYEEKRINKKGCIL
jgi:hypothetical protein